MKCLSRQDIEAIATRVVNAYYKLPELQGEPIYRIDPELLLQSLLGLSVDYHHLSPDNSIPGLTSATPFGVEIYEDDDTQAIYYLDGSTYRTNRKGFIYRCHSTRTVQFYNHPRRQPSDIQNALSKRIRR